MLARGARWLSGRVSDSGARGPGFETYRRRVVSLGKTLYSPKVLVNYPGSDGSVPMWLKNCWLGRKASTQPTKSMLARSFLIKSSSMLLVSRTGLKARMSLISGPDQTTHFGATCPWMTKILHFWTWISLRPVGQSWSNFMCRIIGGGERLHNVLRQIGSKLWCPWQQKAPIDLQWGKWCLHLFSVAFDPILFSWPIWKYR